MRGTFQCGSSFRMTSFDFFFAWKVNVTWTHSKSLIFQPWFAFQSKKLFELGKCLLRTFKQDAHKWRQEKLFIWSKMCRKVWWLREFCQSIIFVLNTYTCYCSFWAEHEVWSCCSREGGRGTPKNANFCNHILIV